MCIAVTAYCGSLFVGHYNHKDLVEHFYEFISSLQCSTPWLLNIGMDWSSVNLAFLKRLQLKLAAKAHSFINIGSCPPHIANNAFKTMLTVLKSTIDLELTVIDLHFFFRCSAAHREDYKLVKQITEITACYMKKHCESRWLSIDRSLVRILEQMPNLHIFWNRYHNKKDLTAKTV